MIRKALFLFLSFLCLSFLITGCKSKEEEICDKFLHSIKSEYSMLFNFAFNIAGYELPESFLVTFPDAYITKFKKVEKINSNTFICVYEIVDFDVSKINLDGVPEKIKYIIIKAAQEVKKQNKKEELKFIVKRLNGDKYYAKLLFEE